MSNKNVMLSFSSYFLGSFWLYLTGTKIAKGANIGNTYIGTIGIKDACIGSVYIKGTCGIDNYIRGTNVVSTFIDAIGIRNACIGSVYIRGTCDMGNYIRDTYIGAIKYSEIYSQLSPILEVELFGTDW